LYGYPKAATADGHKVASSGSAPCVFSEKGEVEADCRRAW